MLVFPYQGLGDGVDAAHSGEDPQLIADGGPAVGAAVALESPGRDGGQGADPGMVGVHAVLAEAGAHVVDVDPVPGGDVRLGQTDGAAVFDDPGPRGNGCQGTTSGGDGLPCGNVLQGHRHVIQRMDADKVHGAPPYRQAA